MANASNASVAYTSFTHGVYLRNAHAQEILLRPSGITWRTLGGSIDLYFFGGPKAEDVTRSYQLSAVGLPAMQQYVGEFSSLCVLSVCKREIANLPYIGSSDGVNAVSTHWSG